MKGRLCHICKPKIKNNQKRIEIQFEVHQMSVDMVACSIFGNGHNSKGFTIS